MQFSHSFLLNTDKPITDLFKSAQGWNSQNDPTTSESSSKNQAQTGHIGSTGRAIYCWILANVCSNGPLNRLSSFTIETQRWQCVDLISARSPSCSYKTFCRSRTPLQMPHTMLLRQVSSAPFDHPGKWVSLSEVNSVQLRIFCVYAKAHPAILLLAAAVVFMGLISSEDSVMALSLIVNRGIPGAC